MAETSFKFHPSCRHTHPAADALQQVLREHRVAAQDVKQVTALVHQSAIDVLGPVTDPQTVHQGKFSMGTVLGLMAVHGHAGLSEFDAHYRDAAVVAVRDKVSMLLDDEVDLAYPARWIGKVVVETMDGKRFAGRVDEPKGDPGNTLSRPEIEDKALRLAANRNGASALEMRSVIDAIWSLSDAPRADVLGVIPHSWLFASADRPCSERSAAAAANCGHDGAGLAVSPKTARHSHARPRR